LSRGPVVVERDNVAHAWAEAFHEITRPGTTEIVPLVVCVTGFDANVVREDQDIRNLLDVELLARGKQSIRTVASTIFPTSLWNPNRLRKYRRNCNGIYFERMVNFQPRDANAGVNQIAYLLGTRIANNHRRSAYQLSIIDPTRDHTNQPRRGFPCLQQVSISPIDGHALSVTGFYATQTLFERAYGNYIGLCELGRFFAHQWGLQLTRVTCVTSVAELDIPMTEARVLARQAMNLIEEIPATMTGANEG